MFSIMPGNAQAGASCAATSSGGLSLSSNECKPFKKARLVKGKAIAPPTAPKKVKRVIRWANQIRNKPYVYGGGHASFNSSGYDCSGAISYALRGGRFVSSPLASTGYMNWKQRGKGKWITVYSNPSHAYVVVAGLRFDTSMTPGNGPGWSKSKRSTPGSFTARHPGRY
jgi:cell wall-associated NlpC family hydrolase